jgi:RNA polymerase sigma-54 factor
MALEIKLNQKLSQSLVMTPQLQQAIKLLQLGRIEYLEVLQKELLENPVLEEEMTGAEDNRDISQSNGQSSPTSNNNQDDSNTDPVQGLDDADKLGMTSISNSDWPDYFDTYTESFPGGVSTSNWLNDDDERLSFESIVSKPEGLAPHILWQLRTTELSEEEQDIALHIVGNLDRNGYLRVSLEELAKECNHTVEVIEKVLTVIQSLDPPGIGARDIKECLCIQLDQLGLKDSLVYRIISLHLDKLEKKRYESIARQEKVSIEDIYDSVKIIQRLEPHPGRPFVDEPPIFITPDIYVKKVGEELIISLNEAGMPKLRLSQRYRELLTKGDTQVDAPNKEYLQDRLRSAAWLIKSIHQRQQTIYRVTESIMKFQKDFIENGVSALKPLVLREVASDVGMHESTISRVTTNKFVHTPQGIYELKFFFAPKLKSDEGAISSESVREKIRNMILAEDPSLPLSDQELMERLKTEGINIARRTVAKYRELSNIPPSSRRKKIF